MKNNIPFVFLVVALAALGSAGAAFRHQTYNIPWMPGAEAQIWQVEARIEFEANDEAAQVYLTLPPTQKGFAVVNESAASSGWGFAIETEDGVRRAHWTQRLAQGRQVLFYKLDLAVSDEDTWTLPPPLDTPPVLWDEPYQTAADHLLSTILPITADAHTVTTQLIQALNRQPADQNINLLSTGYSPIDLITRILLTADIPARPAQALALEDGRRRQALAQYVQVWDGLTWRLYHPVFGEISDTSKLLLWQVGGPGVLEVLGGTNSRVSFSILSQTTSSLLIAQEQAGDLALSLYNLPIAEQGMFKLIMLLPVGALVVVFLRAFVGIRTSGTFMPILIALAFLQTQLIPGLLSFIIVVAIGLFIRSYLSALNLLLVARIATLVVLVIMIISLFSVVSYRLGLIQGLTITFFPMIILAWTIERMSITWEEEGAKEVFIQGGGSLLVAIFAFLLMDTEIIEHLAFNFPELHLVLLAIMLLLGRYTGYRLLELKRFAAFNR